MKRTIQHLDAIHSQVSNVIADVEPELLSKRPAENEWSIGEVIHHLLLVEERVVAELERNLNSPPAKVGKLKSLIPMRMVSWRFIRVKAPKLVVPEGFNNTAESLKSWDTCRSRLKQLLASTDASRLKQTAFRHPVFGEINGVAAISMVAYHEERHYKQIQEILAKVA